MGRLLRVFRIEELANRVLSMVRDGWTFGQALEKATPEFSRRRRISTGQAIISHWEEHGIDPEELILVQKVRVPDPDQLVLFPEMRTGMQVFPVGETPSGRRVFLLP